MIKKINGKKGAVFFYLLIFTFLLITGYLILQMNKKTVNINYIGEAQQRIVDAYELAERTLLYLDINTRLSAEKALISTNSKGGFSVNSFEHDVATYPCGIVVYPLLLDVQEIEGCFGFYKQSIKEELLKEFMIATTQYPELSLQGYGYDAVVESSGDDLKIKLFSLSPLRIPIYYDVDDYYNKERRRTSSIAPVGSFVDTPEGYKKTTGYTGVPRGQTQIDTIVLHYTVSLTVQSALNALSASRLSYHYIIDKDGTIYQLVDEDLAAQHAGCSINGNVVPGCKQGYNQRSIGVSFVNIGFEAGNFKRQNPELYGNLNCAEINGQCWEIYTDEQISAVTKLLVEIKNRQEQLGNSLTLNESTIIYHSDITSTKVDPGPAFNKRDLLEKIQTYQSISANNDGDQSPAQQNAPVKVKLQQGQKLTEEEAAQLHNAVSYENFASNRPSFTVTPTAYYTSSYLDFNSWCSPTKGQCITSIDSIRNIYGGSTATSQCLAAGGGYCCIAQQDRGFFEDIKCQGSGIYNGDLYKYNTVSTTPDSSTFIEGFSRGQTATGTDPIKQWTIAVNSKPGSECYIPYNTLVYVYFGENNPWNGVYRAEDTGGAFLGKCKIDFYAGVGNAELQEATKHIDSSKPAQVFIINEDLEYIPFEGLSNSGVSATLGEISVPYAYTHIIKNAVKSYDFLQEFLKKVSDECSGKPLADKQSCLDEQIISAVDQNEGQVSIQRVCLEQGFQKPINITELEETYTSWNTVIKIVGQIANKVPEQLTTTTVRSDEEGTYDYTIPGYLYVTQIPTNDLITLKFDENSLPPGISWSDFKTGDYVEFSHLKVLSVNTRNNKNEIAVKAFDPLKPENEQKLDITINPEYIKKEIIKDAALKIADCSTSEQAECKCNVEVPLIFDEIFFSKGKLAISEIQENNYVELSHKIYEQNESVETSISRTDNEHFSKRIKYYDLRFKKNNDGTFTYVNSDHELELEMCVPKNKHFLMCVETKQDVEKKAVILFGGYGTTKEQANEWAENLKSVLNVNAGIGVAGPREATPSNAANEYEYLMNGITIEDDVKYYVVAYSSGGYIAEKFVNNHNSKIALYYNLDADKIGSNQDFKVYTPIYCLESNQEVCADINNAQSDNKYKLYLKDEDLSERGNTQRWKVHFSILGRTDFVKEEHLSAASQLLNVVKSKKVLVMGDSITKHGSSSKGYVSLANKLLEQKDIKLDAVGYSGCGTGLISSCLIGGQESDQKCVVDCLTPANQVNSFDLDNYDTVMVLAGVNDGIDPRTTKNNLKKIYDEMKSKGKIVVAITILPVRTNTAQYPHVNDAYLQNIQDLNTWIKEQDNVDLVIDPYSKLADITGQLKQEYARDPIHPNDDGHKVLSEVVAEKLGDFKTVGEVGKIAGAQSIRFSIKI